MNEFQHKYKSIDTTKLIEIILDSASYQPIAVEAAKHELSLRNISEQEIQRIKDDFTLKNDAKAQKQAQFKKVENKAKEYG